jgi:hypothetical protein
MGYSENASLHVWVSSTLWLLLSWSLSMSDFGTDKLVERLNDLELHIELLHAQAVSTRMKETFLVKFLEQRGIIQEGEFAAYVKKIAQDCTENSLESVAVDLVYESNELGNGPVTF